MDPAVWLESDIVKAAYLDPVEKILPAIVSVENRRPGNGQRVHAVFVLEQVRGVGAVFTATAGDNAVVVTIIAAVLIQNFQQLPLSRFPINLVLFVCIATRIADSFLVNMQGWCNAITFVLEFRK